MTNVLQSKDKRKGKVKRRTTQSLRGLPHNFRIQVVERLANDGIAIVPQTVTDILGGRNKNFELVKKVTNALTEIKEQHLEKEAQLTAMLSI